MPNVKPKPQPDKIVQINCTNWDCYALTSSGRLFKGGSAEVREQGKPTVVTHAWYEVTPKLCK